MDVILLCDQYLQYPLEVVLLQKYQNKFLLVFFAFRQIVQNVVALSHSYAPETIFSNLCIVTLTFDLLTSKSIGHILDSWGVCMWSFMMIGVKGKQLCAGNHFQ